MTLAQIKTMQAARRVAAKRDVSIDMSKESKIYGSPTPKKWRVGLLGMLLLHVAVVAIMLWVVFDFMTTF